MVRRAALPGRQFEQPQRPGVLCSQPGNLGVKIRYSRIYCTGRCLDTSILPASTHIYVFCPIQTAHPAAQATRPGHADGSYAVFVNGQGRVALAQLS
jgi:hypothetical protein